MERIYDLSNPDEPDNRKKIASIVLKDTGMDNMLSADEATKVRVDYGSITECNRKDELITVSFGPESNIMAVYTNGEDGYDYVGEVGHFNGVDNISIICPKDSDADVILFRERNNQSVGALENSGFIRGCIYSDGEFKKVLSIDENIESWWHECSDGDDDKWCRIIQTSKIMSSDEYRTINVEKNQVYSVADEPNSKIKPNDGDFVEKAARTVHEEYLWDDDWRVYLLGKKIEKNTGKEVAVLQDYGNSSYVLTGDNFDKYKIMRDDGTVDIVNHDDLEDESNDSPSNETSEIKQMSEE